MTTSEFTGFLVQRTTVILRIIDIQAETDSFATHTGIDKGALTRYRDTLPAQTVAFLEKSCLPELFWQAPA